MNGPLAIDPQYRQYWDQFDPLGPELPSTGFSAADAVMRMLAQSHMGNLTSQRGLLPIGGSVQNPYKRMQDMRLQKQFDDVMSRSSDFDQQTAFQFARGITTLPDRPWGPEQEAESRRMSKDIVPILNTLTQALGPGADVLGGSRGTEAAARYNIFTGGGRYRIDPTTGKAGLGAEATAAISGELAKLQGKAGIPLGEMGALFTELQYSGMLPSASSNTEALAQLFSRGNREDPNSIAGRIKAAGLTAGVDFGSGAGVDPGRGQGQLPLKDGRPVITPEQEKAMLNVPEVAAAVKQFDPKQVAQRVGDYSKAVNAMKDIFGESGNPNAPMPELIAALNSMTGGSMSQMQPAKVEQTVRTMWGLARNTGLNMEGLTMMGQMASQQAQAMGLAPVMASDALMGSLGYRAALQQGNAQLAPGWGQGTIEQMTVKDMQLRLSAQGSPMANQMALARRMKSADPNVFKGGTAGAAYLQAIEAGQTTFQDPVTGEQRSMQFQSDAEFVQMMSQDTGMSQAQLNTMLGQTFTNQEFVGGNVASIARRSQHGETMRDLQDVTAVTTATSLGPMLDGLDPGIQSRLLGRIQQGVTTNLSGLDPPDLVSAEKRNAAINKAIEDEIKNAEISGEMSPEQAKQARDFMGSTPGKQAAGSIWGELERAGQMGLPGGQAFDTGVQMFESLNQKTLAAGEAAQRKEQIEAGRASALAPLGGESSGMRRAIDAVLKAKPGESIQDTLAGILGAEDITKVAGLLEGEGINLDKMSKAEARYQEAAAAWEKDPTNEKLKKEMDERQETLQAYMTDFEKTAKKEGVEVKSLQQGQLDTAMEGIDKHLAGIEGTDEEKAKIREELRMDELKKIASGKDVVDEEGEPVTGDMNLSIKIGTLTVDGDTGELSGRASRDGDR